MLKRREFLFAAAGLLSIPGGSLAAAGRKPDVPARAPGEPSLRELIAAARSWGYQLQEYDLSTLEASNVDLLVIDLSIAGPGRDRLTSTVVRRLKRKPDGSRRIVLCYLSIGEAEEYRDYWRKDWIETDAELAEVAPADPTSKADQKGSDRKNKADTPTGRHSPRGGEAHGDASKPGRRVTDKAPVWLSTENESWSGNFAVHYWDPGWQSLIVGRPGCYLERILDAGFDGVYLDRVDAFYEHEDERTDAAEEMVAFVARIAREARARVPGFLIVPQNGEELLTKRGYVGTIDAIAKEDLLYGSPAEGIANSSAQIYNSSRWLSLAQQSSKPVLVIEYLSAPDEIEKARAELAKRGFVATFGPRMLDRISPQATAVKAKSAQ
ncbi:MAG: endo alpha-1,4 polygalactosaminidase [Hyphomicrobiaceae bacterium]|nr:endo alpha-1,4 polygalactosaminidase [Hyphomicrobiaceae bacterium]